MIDNIANTNIYNTDNISIKVSNDSINIYNLYITINKYIYNTKRELTKLSKELNKASGGPPDVQAIQYDKIGSSAKIQNINEIYKQVAKIKNKMDEVKEQLKNLQKSKKDLEDTFREADKYNEKNIELKVFIGKYIDKKSLKEISEELTREDSWGRETNYSYQYLRLIHAKIKKQIG